MVSLAHRDVTEIPGSVAIDRKSRLSRDEFERHYLAGCKKPVVITDALDDWPAREKWTFDFFRNFPTQTPIIANSPFFMEDNIGLRPVSVKLRLADYIDYLVAPQSGPVGEFLSGTLEDLRFNEEKGVPLYAPNGLSFSEFPDLLDDVRTSPYFADDWLALLNKPTRLFLNDMKQTYWLFLAPAGATAFLHVDYASTHAYLALLEGHKHVVLFSPEDSVHLRIGDSKSSNEHPGSVADPRNVDPEIYPNFHKAKPYVGTVKAGELVFIPGDWYHFVTSPVPSITFSYNYFDRTNFAEYFRFFVNRYLLVRAKLSAVTRRDK